MFILPLVYFKIMTPWCYN